MSDPAFETQTVEDRLRKYCGGVGLEAASVITALRAEVERMREALEHIVERSLNDPIGTSKVLDMRQIARAALSSALSKDADRE